MEYHLIVVHKKFQLGWAIGQTGKRVYQRIQESKEYKSRYIRIEPELRNGFEYNQVDSEAIIIRKNVKLLDMEDESFIEDLTYLVNLYKSYEIKYENAILDSKIQDKKENNKGDKTQLQEINIRMIELIEQVGNLAKEIKELNSKIM